MVGAEQQCVVSVWYSDRSCVRVKLFHTHAFACVRRTSLQVVTFVIVAAPIFLTRFLFFFLGLLLVANRLERQSESVGVVGIERQLIIDLPLFCLSNVVFVVGGFMFQFEIYFFLLKTQFWLIKCHCLLEFKLTHKSTYISRMLGC